MNGKLVMYEDESKLSMNKRYFNICIFVYIKDTSEISFHEEKDHYLTKFELFALIV